MRIIFILTWIFLAGLFFSSCITTMSVPIDQMEPGKVVLPPAIRKVALISRNFKFSIDTLAGYQNINYRLQKGLMADNQIIDSLAVTRSMDTLRKVLLESGRFDEVFVYPHSAIKPHIGNKELPFSESFIKSICTESQTDAVISLEMLSFFYSRHNGTSNHEIIPEANVKVTAIWSVYVPDRDEPVDRFTHSEVIRWNENSTSSDNQSFKLPGRKVAISIACGVAAKNYSQRIVPHWTESKRVIIGLQGQEWEKAGILAKNNKWKNAAGIWKKFADSSSPRIAGVAALNFAVAQEMLGDMDKATYWSDQSVKLLKTGETGRIARDYAAILHNRKLKALSLKSLLKDGQP